MQPRKVKLGNGCFSALGGAKVFRRIRPMAREAGAEQHDTVRPDRAVLLLPALEIGGCNLIVRALGRGVRDVDDDCQPDEILQRDLIDSLSPLREVHRRIDMRAAVFRRQEVVGRVVVAGWGDAVGHLIVTKWFGGRPEDGLRVVGVREVDDLAGGKCGRGARGLGGTCRCEEATAY